MSESRTPSRRDVLATSAVVLGAGALAACGSQGAGGGGDATPSGTVSLTSIPVGGAVVQQVGGQPVVLSRPEAGTVKAFSGQCTHQGCAVVVDDTRLVCPCHGSIFDATTGAVEQGPAQDPLPALAAQVSGDNVTLG